MVEVGIAGVIDQWAAGVVKALGVGILVRGLERLPYLFFVLKE